jgi:cold shock CspA family protein
MPRRRTTGGHVDGSVVRRHDELGWGVLAADELDGGVWAHFSVVVMEGSRSLRQGQPVRFMYETPGQDGFAHLATEVRPLREA